MSLSLPEDKLLKVTSEANSLLSMAKPVSGLILARMVGLLSSCIPAVLPAPLHFRQLQVLKNAIVATGGYNHTAEGARGELSWWITHLSVVNGRALSSPSPDIIIYTDASMWGWGAVSGQTKTGGAWSNQERSYHINYL